MATPVGPELHLPDLPEVRLAAPVPRARERRAGRWQRLPQWLGQNLPLLLMGVLALGTWWLVRSTPTAPGPVQASGQRTAPDYTMHAFSITRFDPDGRVSLRIDGDLMRHYPDTDRLEIEGVRIQAIAPDGRRTDATAHRALASGDGSEVQLIGGAQVVSQLGDGQTLEVRSEFLHALLRFERLKTRLPVSVRHGQAQTQAGGMDYDNLTRTLDFIGPVKAVWPPPAAGGAARPGAAR